MMRNQNIILSILLVITTLVVWTGCDQKGVKYGESSNYDIFTLVGNGDLAMVKDLLKNAPPEKFNVKEPLAGNTPLIMACVYGHLDIAQWLIENGADINAVNNDKNSPLHIASYHCYPDIVKLLIHHGADLTVKNRHDYLAYSVVARPWTSDIEGHYKFIHSFFHLELDLERIRSTRGEIAAILEAATGPLPSSELPSSQTHHD